MLNLSYQRRYHRQMAEEDHSNSPSPDTNKKMMSEEAEQVVGKAKDQESPPFSLV